MFKKGKMRKKMILPLLLLAVKGLAQADTVQPVRYNLQQCIDIAAKNNIDVKQREWQAATDKAYWQQSKAAMLPLLNADVSHGVNTGRNIDPFTNTYNSQTITYGNYGLNSSVTLWNGNALRNIAEQNRLTYQADQLDAQQTRENITLNVILAYLQVLNNREQQALADSQAYVTKRQVERLAILNADGAISPYEYHDLKGQLANENINAINAKNALESSKISLFQLMNIPFNEKADFEKIDKQPESNAVETSRDIYGIAANNLPMIKAAALRRQSAAKGMNAARGARWPRLYLAGGLGTTYSSAASTALLTGSADVATTDYVNVNNVKLPVYTTINNYSSKKIAYTDQWTNNFNSNISVGISIPILNAGQAKARIRLAEMAVQQADFTETAVQTQLRGQVEQAHVNYTTAFYKYRQLADQVKDYAESFRSAEIRFNAGVINSVDYLIAKNNLDRSRGNLIATQYDVLLRSKILDYYKGKPLF
jgi:outer membrane protein